ncbi:hypothetical protein EWI73_20235 [Salmonella bongori]|uniref:Oligosaccharide flippase family protein n=1 Tax=Salmonella bongori TaxID=54736 RepID=A0A8F8FPQ7_SALBN|nr:oligosaccharide flippase family protein [Salmonella bongori]QXY86078.1 hypothetical protein EWI73_20235 [Salmonella bongori]
MHSKLKMKKLLDNAIVKNILWLISEKLYFVILIFFGEGLISRTLGVNDYGKWIYSLNIIIIISSVALIAGSEVMVPALSKNKKLAGELITSAFIIRFSGALLSFLVLNIYSLVLVNDLVIQHMLLSLSLVLLFNEPFGAITNYFQAKIDMKKVVLARCLSLALRTIFVLVAFKIFESNLIYFSRASESILLAIILSLLLYKSKIRLNFSKKVFLIVLKRGCLLWVPLISMMIYLRIDRFFVEKYFSYETLAMYGVAVQFIEQAFLLLVIVIQTISPKYIFQSMPKKTMLKNIKLISLLLIMLVFMMQVFCLFFLKSIITIVYGDSYIQAATLAISLLPSLLFYAVDTILMQVFYKYRNNKAILTKWISMMFFSCAMYYIWFDLLSKSNVTMVFNINYLTMSVITFVLFRRGLKDCKND